MLNKIKSTRYHQILSFGLATSATLGIMAIFPMTARALSFTGPFAPSNWTFTNTDADGTVDTTNAVVSKVILTGGNNGSVKPGTTDWTIPIDSSRAGTVNFDWRYSTLDTPGNDSAGYLLNGVYTPLASQDEDASTFSVSINLNVGDVFGFRAETLTNSDGPPVFTIYDSSIVVPEPSMVLGLLTVLGVGVTLKRKS